MNIKVYIDRLRNGKEESIDSVLDAGFLQGDDQEITFQEDGSLMGRAYLAGDMLCVQCTASATARMPCRICNEETDVLLESLDVVQAVPLDEIKGGIYDLSDEARTTLFLQIPSVVECNEGTCPEREFLKNYLT